MMMILLTCVMFVHLTTSQQQQQLQKPGDEMTSTVASTELDCDQRASCRYTDQRSRNCYCDHLCHIYGDCCEDYDVTTSDVITPSRSTVSCQRLPDVMTRDVMTGDAELYVVSRCPSSYNDSDVRRRCELHASDNAADRFYRIPVVVHPDPLRLTYRNVYCAACSAVAARPTFYVIEVRCKSLDAGVNVSVQSLLRSSSCRSVYVAPPLVTSSRTCRFHIGRCDRRWADKAVIGRCRQGPVSYVYAGEHAFRNRDCAHCNYVNDTYITCDVMSTSQWEVAAAENNVDSWRTVAVIDLNQRRSVLTYITLHHHHQQQQQDAVFDLPRCQQQHVYDPFSEQCRLVPSLQFTDSRRTTPESPQHVTSSVAVVNASGTYRQFSLYIARSRAERLTALLASVMSVMALVVVVVVYAVRPALRIHVHGQTVLGLVVSLLLMQLLYMFVVPLVDVIGSASVTCFCLSVLLHYVSLTSLCWLNALAINSRDGEKCRSFACCCIYAMSAGLPVVISMMLLSVLQLDGSDGGPACWSLGLGQLMLHVIMLGVVLSVNFVLYVVTLCRRRRPVTGPMCVSVLLTLIVMSDAVMTVTAAVLAQSSWVTKLSLAMHAALGPLVCLSTLLPVCLHAHSCLRPQFVGHQ